MALLTCENLTHIYSPKTPFELRALNNINLSIESGSFIGVMGHTGSGKSTLISHFNGLLKPTSGRILLNGVDIWEKPKQIRKIRFRVGLVFQFPEHQLFEETVFKDIAFGPTNMGLTKDEIDNRVITAAKTVGLDDHLLNKSPFELSGGQKRRAAIAGVLAMEPELLILDEPTAGLDPRGTEELIDNIRSYHADGDRSVVIVSHNMDEIARISQRIIVMKNGEIAIDGNTKDVFAQKKEIEAAGLQVPFVSRVLYRLNNLGVDIETSVFDYETAARLLKEHKIGGGNCD